MDANRVIAASTTIATGDVVWGRPVVEGKTMPRRKGIVLGYFDQSGKDTANLVIWWYGMGPASMETTTLMFTSELTKAGDIWGNFRGLKASKLARGCYHFSRAHSVGRSLESHARRMLSIGIK